ncbi:hypothetical protein EXIGLDRAFT_847871 [Exidia glandulosa HHB12029]|uniref:Uncharacterized protein n=1 Tax=Exidia glandulosa HHB12029 TaxID=1314781 RepID=A0A166MG93_EXIGL|nr:hypothetical protein EXIGLDRAFT_847871 [Exidia glandulosa HHB12029]
MRPGHETDWSLDNPFASVPTNVISAPALGPDPSISRSECTQHSTGVVRNAMKKLVDMLDLPDLTTKRGLKRCYHDFDLIMDKLLDKVSHHADHLSTAAVLALCRICGDSGLCGMLEPSDALSALLPCFQQQTTLRESS